MKYSIKIIMNLINFSGEKLVGRTRAKIVRKKIGENGIDRR